MFKDRYFYIARVFPALITSIPMLVFFNKIISVQYHSALKNVLELLPMITHLGLSAAVIFLCVQINRFLAKEVFQRFYFNQELHMPTTSLILWKSNYYDDAIKTKIRDKIQQTFEITLLSPTEEQQNENKARSLIATAVSQIRIALESSSMLSRHNIEYGFWRNLMGGSLLALIFAAANFYYGHSSAMTDLQTFGIFMFVIYLIPICFSKLIMQNYGRYYGKILYEQFLSL